MPEYMKRAVWPARAQDLQPLETLGPVLSFKMVTPWKLTASFQMMVSLIVSIFSVP